MPCPDCGTPSVRRHSGSQRRLADDAVGGRQVCIELTVRRLFCDAPGCTRVTFRGTGRQADRAPWAADAAAGEPVERDRRGPGEPGW
ncbi:transposase family protein [Streptomyces sp. NBC_01340]|nr:transposase family protein [Streptomyces sp. NBC_01719]MCX4497653.1 transposase family protein [Streptomyces sp. NBC_01728]WSI44432.1 transposase family protein [Streptomyces sp. NBC_01340]